MSTNAPEGFLRVAESWRPDTDVVEGTIDPRPAAALGALLVAPPIGFGDVLPPLWHEVYLRPVWATTDLATDGHPVQDVLVPDIADRRRMFGGGRLRIEGPIYLGERVRRSSRVESIRTREGRSGWLLLVTERHELSVDGELRVVDERDIVYRLPADVTVAAPTSAPGAQEPAPPVIFSVHPDERMLFQFSALTYNAHRIHYDRTYTTEVEGHPDLVVHGPLLALQALEVARAALGAHARTADYRLLAPAYCGRRVDFTVPACGARSASVVAAQDGRQCLSLNVTTEG
jgi:hydroxyacyl-ACP dehydratase HTD2-like protein with hotdog domain